jgi:hypothetical protein
MALTPATLLLQGFASDIEVVVSDKVYRLHKPILSDRSGFFKAAFDFDPTQTRIAFPEGHLVTCRIMDALVQCWYLGCTHVFSHSSLDYHDSSEEDNIAMAYLSCASPFAYKKNGCLNDHCKELLYRPYNDLVTILYHDDNHPNHWHSFGGRQTCWDPEIVPVLNDLIAGATNDVVKDPIEEIHFSYRVDEVVFSEDDYIARFTITINKETTLTSYHSENEEIDLLACLDDYVVGLYRKAKQDPVV